MLLFLHNNSKYSQAAIQLLKELNIDHFSSADRVYKFPEYDIGIGFLYPYKIPVEQLNKKWYNFHPGLLPHYGGRNLCYHAIMEDTKEFGGTMHIMDENFDTGPIVSWRNFPIEDWMTAGDVFDITCWELFKLFKTEIQRIINNLEMITIQYDNIRYFKKEPINDYIELTEKQQRQVRAVTTDKFYAKTKIGGIDYKIVKI